MPILVPYTQADYAVVHAYFPDKEIRKYTNRGGMQYSHYQDFMRLVLCCLKKEIRCLAVG